MDGDDEEKPVDKTHTEDNIRTERKTREWMGNERRGGSGTRKTMTVRGRKERELKTNTWLKEGNGRQRSLYRKDRREYYVWRREGEWKCLADHNKTGKLKQKRTPGRGRQKKTTLTRKDRRRKYVKYGREIESDHNKTGELKQNRTPSRGRQKEDNYSPGRTDEEENVWRRVKVTLTTKNNIGN